MRYAPAASERFFDLQLRFARTVATIAPLPFPEAVLAYTALYRILGLSGEFAPDHPVWQSYVHGLGDKETHAAALCVTGGSWLYNWDAYLRLFPARYRDSVRPGPPRFQYRSLWGQFLRRDGEVREDLAGTFMERLSGLHEVSDAGSCFPYQVLTARCEIHDFFAFYEV